MEKINVAEILKNCPQGMELDCTMYENCTFDAVFDYCLYPIQIKTPVGLITLNKYGSISKNPYSKCMIFPKGKTTWEGFVPPCKFKDGDIIFTHSNCLKVGVGNSWISIFKEKRNGGVATYVDYAEDGSDYYSDLDGDKALLCMERDILRQRLATEEEKEKLFKAIKANGYKWDPETKTLEKLIEPKFKLGDRIIYKSMYLAGKYGVFSIDRITEDEYVVVMENTQQQATISIQDQNEFMIAPEMRLVLEKKFDITTLKPFDKVLVRLTNGCVWMPKFFSHYDTGPNVKYYPFVTTDNIGYPQCIPYNGNEHLCRKTYDCDEFYKTWE